MSHSSISPILLDLIVEKFNITHSYYSSPLTCPTSLTSFRSPHPRDCVFGATGSSTSHKWHGNGIAIPPHFEAKQALKWAKIAASQHSTTFTILLLQDANWNTLSNPMTHPHSDIQILAHFPRNTLKYYPNHPFPSYIHNTELEAMSLICVHQWPSTPRTMEFSYYPHIQSPTQPPSPYLHTQNKTLTSRSWKKAHPPPTPPPLTHPSPPLPNFPFDPPLKFPILQSIYTDGSVFESSVNTKAGYGVYSAIFEEQIAARLPGRQNILRAELMAIHKATTLLHPEETTFIFTDSLVSLFLLRNYKNSPSAHKHHPDRFLLEAILTQIAQHPQPTQLLKVRSHVGIFGNEKADKLAKIGVAKPPEAIHGNLMHIYHPFPHYLHSKTFRTGPIRNLDMHLLLLHKHQLQHRIIPKQPSVQKWTSNDALDHTLSNAFWKDPKISQTHISQILKFRNGQYMGNCRKHIFWPKAFPSIFCALCNQHSTNIDTWPHLLASCHHPVIKGLHMDRHNKALNHIREMFLTHHLTRWKCLTNGSSTPTNPCEHTVPSWILPHHCTCPPLPCQCPTRLCPDILLIEGLPTHALPPTQPTQAITLHYIEFTYCHDRFPDIAIQRKIDKYTTLIRAVETAGWKVKPLLVLTAGQRGGIHVNTSHNLSQQFKLPPTKINRLQHQLHTTALHSLSAIILNKRKLESKLPHHQTQFRLAPLPNHPS
jgi:ribonuclease HI